MYSLVEHMAVGILLLLVGYFLLDFLHVHKNSRAIIEMIVWAIAMFIGLSGLWMPVL